MMPSQTFQLLALQKASLSALMIFAVFASTSSWAQSAAPLEADHAAIQSAVDASERSAADRERDARSDITDLLAFMQTRPGLWAADIFAGGGYFSELLARAAGPEGRIYAQNPAAFRAFSVQELAERFVLGRMPNVIELNTEPDALGLPEGKLDLILIVMGYHDLYYVNAEQGWPQRDPAQFFAQLRSALKEDGVLVIIDHAAVTGSGSSAAQELHRIDESFAQQDIESRGFKLQARFDGLRNTSDARTVNVFDSAIRGKTDLFVHRYVKATPSAN